MLVENSDFSDGNSPVLLQSRYVKSHCSAGVLHIGIGAFHRAHQAYYFDCLLNEGNTQWGIIGVNLQPQEEATIKQLQCRNNNYVLKTISPNQVVQYHEIGSILRTFENVNIDANARSILGDSNIQLITVTISESGYYLTPNGDLDCSNSKVRADIEVQGFETIYGYLRQILKHREQSNGLPITVACCDNMINNGHVLSKTFKQFLQACEDDYMLEWVEKNVSFPRSMVDRITPKVDKCLSQEMNQLFCLKDDSSVLAESYIQWVIEDDFKGNRPPLEQFGVEFVENIEAFENLKISVLNGGHSCIAYLSALLNYIHFDKAFNDQAIKDFFLLIQRNEILPTVSGFSENELERYLKVVCERFENIHISDTVERICMEGYAKIQFYLLPMVKNNLEQGNPPQNLIKSLAYWYVFIVRISRGELQFNYDDSHWSFLKQLVEQNSVEKFCQSEGIWGSLPECFPIFSQLLEQKIMEIEESIENGVFKFN